MGGGRSPCCDKDKVKRGPWTPAEDVRLVSFIQKHGHPNWRSLPKQAGLLRCGKSCRLRWINYLRPDVKRGNFTPQEEHAIIRLHATFGNKWSKIAAHLPGRTDNEIKNVWNTHLKKRSVLKNDDDANKSLKHQETISSSEYQEDDQVQNPKVVEDKRAILVKDIFIDQPSKPSSTVSSNSDQDKTCCLDETTMINLDPTYESEVEFWNMLEPLDDHDDGLSKNQDTDVEHWMRLLEQELGLVSPSPPPASQQLDQNDRLSKDYNEQQSVSEVWCKINHQISPFWPTSPQNFGF